jgi:hypothetical protein
MENNAQRATNILRIANKRFLQAGSDIQFYLQSQVTIRDASPFAQAPLTAAQIQNMFINDLNYNRITIHMIGAETNNSGGTLGMANLPVTPIDRVCYVRTQGAGVRPIFEQDRERIGGTLAHELGHVLGLLHTHHPGRFMSTVANFNGGNADVFNRCFQEAVNRNTRNRWFEGCLDTNNELSCEINGDFLCDTEADPRLTGPGIDYNDNPNVCDYELPINGDYRFDNRGDEWNPNPLNIMAYANRRCRSFFSNGQRSIMWDFLDTRFSALPMEIAGPQYVSCNSSTSFSIPVVTGATYNWQVTSGFSITAGANSRQVSVRGSSGFHREGILTVTVNTAYGTFCIKRIIRTGGPRVSNALIIGPDQLATGNSAFYYVSGVQNVSSYSWQVTGTGWSLSNQSGTSATITAGTGIGSIRVTVTNQCGSSQLFKTVLTSGDNCEITPYYTLSPNPSFGDVTIERDLIRPCPILLSSMNDEEEEKRILASSYQIFLYHPNGNLAQQYETSENRYILPTNGLRKGLYTVIIMQDNFVDNKKLIIR